VRHHELRRRKPKIGFFTEQIKAIGNSGGQTPGLWSEAHRKGNTLNFPMVFFSAATPLFAASWGSARDSGSGLGLVPHPRWLSQHALE